MKGNLQDMDIIFLLLAFSLIISAGFLIAFLTSARKGQFDDVEGPAMRVLLEDATNNNTHS